MVLLGGRLVIVAFMAIADGVQPCRWMAECDFARAAFLVAWFHSAPLLQSSVYSSPFV